MQNIGILGGSGLIGTEFINICAINNLSVTNFSRRELSFDNQNVKNVIVDFDNIENSFRNMHLDAVIIAFGTTMKKAGSKAKFMEIDHKIPLEVAKVLKNNGCSKLIIVSSYGASSSSSSFYLKVKAKIEKDIIELDFDSTVILRPSLLVGNRQEFRLGEEIGAVLGKLFKYVPYLKKYKPIKASTVAKAIYILLNVDNKKMTFSLDEIEKVANEN